VVQTSLCDAVEQYEKDLIVDALKSARGNRAKAARLLGSTERIIGYKVRKYGIDPGRFAEGRWWRPCLSAGSRWAVAWDASHRRNCRMTSLKHSPEAYGSGAKLPVRRGLGA